MFLELPKIMNDPTVRISPFVFLTNALAAFGEPAGGMCFKFSRRRGQGMQSRCLRPHATCPGHCASISDSWRISPPTCSGFWIDQPTLVAGLNMAVFLLIGKTSALTMNIAGVVKDWMLIGLSVWMFKSAVSGLNLFG